MSTVIDVLDAARTHLNDTIAADWQDTEILPKFQEAYRELVLKLRRAGLPMVQNVTGMISVPQNTTDFTVCTGYPSDIVQPIWLTEGLPGQDLDYFQDMNPRDFLPFTVPQSRLTWWAWQKYKVIFVGSFVDTVVVMRYWSSLPIPQLNTDPIGLLEADTFLSFRTAALCLEQMPGQEPLAVIRNTEALAHIDDVIAINVTYTSQMLPARKRPYHRRRSAAYQWQGW